MGANYCRFRQDIAHPGAQGNDREEAAASPSCTSTARRTSGTVVGTRVSSGPSGS